MPNYVLKQGDCLRVLPTLHAQTIDLVVADLPYGTTQNRWDNPIPFIPMWEQLLRVTKPTAVIALMAAQPFAAQLICSNPKLFRYDLIWAKNKATGFLNAKKQPLRAHEHILIFYRAPPFYTPQMTRGHEPGHYAKRAKKSTNYGAYDSTEYGGRTERYPLSILQIPVINNDSPEKIHPTQKPVELMEWLIKSYSLPGHLVLDITMGVGTTGVAALKNARGFVGIEWHPEYYLHAEQWLASL